MIPAGETMVYREILSAISSGQLERAAEACQEAIRNRPTDGRAWLLLAAVHNRLGDVKRSIDHLRMAAANAGDDRALLREAVDALLNIRAFSEAEQVLENADLSDPLLVLALARCRWNRGEYARARTMMAELWNLFPTRPPMAIYYARALMSLDDRAEAARVLDTALAQYPDDRELQSLRARVLVSEEGVDRALEWIRARGDPGVPDQYGLLARALADIRRGQLSSPGPLDKEWRPAWEGFAELFSLKPERWVGDNTVLLNHAVSAAPAEGLIVECGVFRGRSINLMAAWAPERRLHGFDSFEGLPENWGTEPAGSYSAGGQLPEVADNVTLHPGWFEDTLPRFAEELAEPIALLYVDCDIYSSTVTILEHLGPKLTPGAIVVFDEYVGYSDWREHEYRAWQEYQGKKKIPWQAVGAVVLGPILALRVG